MSDTVNVIVPDGRAENPSRVARFGVFELDFRTAELRRDGVKVKLQEQPFCLLRLLIERAGDIVTREELQQTLWPNEFVDFDHSLNAAVRKLRTALDDSADNPRFVETLARRGYRFIAPVQWSGSGAATATPQPSVVSSRPIPWSPIAVAAIAVFIVIVAILVIRGRGATARSIDAIAVLPFTTDDKQNEHVNDGLTELLIDSLSRLPNLRVMARTTVFRYKADQDPVRVARDLNVRALVTGRIQREQEQYAIRVELVDVRDGSLIWGQHFNGRVTELASLQREISEELSLQLRRGLDREKRQLVARSVTNSPEAYELYLKGLYAWNNRDREDLQKALAYFNEALQYDPQFAGAYAGIANVYGVMIGYGILTPEEGTPKVLAAARRALQFDPENAEALTSIATTEFRNLWDFAGADRDFRRAIASNPSYATAHQWYSDYLRTVGRVDESRREIDAAYRLDPFAPAVAISKCASLYNDRRYDEAIAFSRRLIRLDKNLVMPRCHVGAWIAKGDYDNAVRAMADFAKDNPSTAASVNALIAAYHRDGSRGFQRQRLALLLANPRADIESPVEVAEVYAQLGDADSSFAWLEKAYARRISKLTNITVGPNFDPIRNDPRFADLLRRIGLPNLPAPQA